MRRLIMLVAALAACGAAAAAADKWTDYSYPDRGFATQFPRPPGIYVYSVSGPNPHGVYSYQSNTSGMVHAVSVRQYSPNLGPQNPGAAYFESLANLYAAGSKSTLRVGSGHAVTIAGYPGYEAVSDSAGVNLHFLLDITAVGNRVFYIVSGGPSGIEASDDAKRFRDAFKFIP